MEQNKFVNCSSQRILVCVTRSWERCTIAVLWDTPRCVGEVYLVQCTLAVFNSHPVMNLVFVKNDYELLDISLDSCINCINRVEVMHECVTEQLS